MALFNKLFSPRRKTYAKNQDIVCTRLFPFSKDQVRVVLFRECDFRGRKLLFDSHAVQKIPIDNEATSSSGTPEGSPKDRPGKNERFAEVSNKFGYVYTKPNPDVGQLGEMIFGSVAMSYRGTSFKIHSLKSPARIMCTQVFPSPRHTKRCRSSAPTGTYLNGAVTSTQSLEHSIPLYDSGTSSTTSVSDHSSNQSTASDTLLVCKGPQSVPLDVPAANAYASSASIIGDSGFSGEQSYSSVSSGPQSCNTLDLSLSSPNTVSFSSNSLYRRWLRSANNSLEYSGGSYTGPSSADEFLLKPNQRTSKLGLAIIINLSAGEEENMMQFLMEHIVLIESLVWRARQGAEGAYIRSHSFVSLMYDIVACISQWLVDLLSGPQLNTNLWLALSNSCDKVKSISSVENSDKHLTDLRTSSLSSLSANRSFLNSSSNSSSSFEVNFKDDRVCDSCDLFASGANKSDFTFLSITKLLKSEWEAVSGRKIYGCDKNFAAEKFVAEFCEVLETVDVKHTNFFISTLLTAVLTHHLGWVTSSSVVSNSKETIINLPTNPLWGQMTDLFGAIGYPSKIAHTIVTGTNKSELISKVLNLLTYFIRCSDIKRNCLSRVDVNKENETVSVICQQNSCIPKENYKKYEDHLKEMATNQLRKQKSSILRKEQDEAKSDCLKETQKTLTKTHTCSKDLSKINNADSLYPKLDSLNDEELKASPCEILDKVKNLNIQAVDSFELTNDEIANKVNKLCRVPPNAVLYHQQNDLVQQFVDIRIASEEVKKVFSPKKVFMEKQTKHSEFSFEKGDIEKITDGTSRSQDKSGVIFVLGDDEQLIGLKRDDDKGDLESAESDLKTSLVTSNSLNAIKRNNNMINSEIKDCGNLKASTSWNGRNVVTTHAEVINMESEAGCLENKATCSGSREDGESKSADDKSSHDYENKEIQSKYRYSGVKFNFQQYPQIFTNYLKSKNLTLSEKGLEFNQMAAGVCDDSFDFTNYGGDSEEIEALQTPSNASELEFTSELIVEKQTKNSKCEQEIIHKNNEEVPKFTWTRGASTKKKKEVEQETELTSKKMRIINLPMPGSTVSNSLSSVPIGYTNSLMRGLTDHYISDMVLQGVTAPKSEWEAALRSDLILAARHPILDQPIDEAVAIIANTDTWEVQLMSSHTYVVDRGSSGVRVGMSQLVANMLESLLQMWRLRASPECCLMYIEQRLQEFCIRSRALAQLLLATDFCSMDLLTSTLQLEVNDVPLLMAIASTHSPQVTQKYGLSFQ